MPVAPSSPAVKRFLSRVDVVPNPEHPGLGDCHIFGSSGSRHYVGGAIQEFYDGKRNITPGRFAYENFIGPIPSGKTVRRICGDSRCVAPHHLTTEPTAPGANRHRPKRTPRRYDPGEDWMDELYFIGEAARILSVAPATLRRWCQAGTIPHVLTRGRRYLWSSDVEQLAKLGYVRDHLEAVKEGHWRGQMDGSY